MAKVSGVSRALRPRPGKVPAPSGEGHPTAGWTSGTKARGSGRPPHPSGSAPTSHTAAGRRPARPAGRVQGSRERSGAARAKGVPLRRPATRRAAGLAVTALLGWLALAAAGPRAEGGGGPLRILMLGDSLTAGHGLAARDALPAKLEAALRARGLDVRVINAGVSGDTTAGGLARLEWALADRPHALIVALGANDALRAIDPALVRSNLDRLLAALAERRLPVLLAGMLAPRNLGRDYGARFDAIYPELALRHGAILYPFLLEGVATVAALNQTDGIHPNAAGVEVIVGRFLPSVLCLVRRAGDADAECDARAAR